MSTLADAEAQRVRGDLPAPPTKVSSVRIKGSEGATGEGGGLRETGVAAATEVISGPMGSHSTQREQAGEVPEIKIIITLH